MDLKMTNWRTVTLLRNMRHLFVTYLMVPKTATRGKGETFPPSECRVDGNIIKIRFSLKKPREPDAALGKEPVCCTSGRADSSTQPKAQEQSYPWSKKANIFTSVPEQKQWLYDEMRGQVTPLPEQKQCLGDEMREQIPSSSRTSTYDNEMQKTALPYKTLLEDWVPLPLQINQNADDDDDWLFKTKQQETHAAKRSKVDNDVTCLASATSCPRAHFLSEAEIYALPCTVPF
ncbi:hypothetical protein REPUB_Repub19eG0014700 [Reevesia pubescens]